MNYFNREAFGVGNFMSLIQRGRFAAALGLAALALTAPAAFANTAGGAVIHNVATLSYDGGVIRATADVTVSTIASGPTLTVDQVAQSGVSGETVIYTYTLTNNANGVDTFNLRATVLDTTTTAPVVAYKDNNGNPLTDGDGDAGARPDLSLGGSVTSQASADGVVYIPAGTQTGLQSGDVVVIGGNRYEITGLVAGTPASTDMASGVTTPESPTAVSLTPAAGSGSPPITAGSLPAGTQLGEQLTFTVELVAGVPTGASGSHEVDLTLASVATDTSGTPVSYTTSVADGNHTTTTVTPRLDPTIIKDVCILSATPACLDGDYKQTGHYAKSGAILQYRITMTAAASNSAADSVLTVEISSYTTYVAGSTTLNGTAVADDAGAVPFPLSAANGGLEVNSPGAPAGEIAAGQQAVVLFRATVQ